MPHASRPDCGVYLCENRLRVLKISEALIRAGAGCKVRECDEEQPNRYVAYVDDDAQSFDVSLEFDAERQPERGSCDCGNRKPCKHIAALYEFVQQGRAIPSVPAAPVKRVPKRTKRPASPAEPLLEDIPVPVLKAWLLETFSGNKELELAFVSRFGGNNTTPDAAAVQKLSQDALKTVMGRKRIPDATLVSRVHQLWKELHKPVVARYAAAPADRDAFDALAAAADAVMDFAARYPALTKKLEKYAAQLLAGFAPQVSLLQQEQAFRTAAGFAIANLALQPHHERVPTIAYLQALSDSLEGERLRWLANALGEQYLRQKDGPAFSADARYALMILHVLRRAGLFADYVDAFRTRAWNPDFNIPLIRAWLEIGMTDRAAQAARSEIRRNTKEIHNLPYRELLRRM